MEQAILDFQQWFSANGGSFHPSIVLKSDSSGVRPVVREDAVTIESRESVVMCPSSIMVSYVHAQQSEILKPLIDRDPCSISNQIITLRVFIIEQYLLADRSFWWPYLKTLPQPSNSDFLHATPLWNDEDLRWLDKTNLAQATRLKKTTWMQEYEQAVECLKTKAPRFVQHSTWELYLWATTIMTSRCFPVASPTNHNEDIPALVPGLDAFNHSPSAGVEWEFSPESYTVKTLSVLPPGSEVFNHYGPKGNAELMIGYGFCLEDNASDWFGLGFSHSVSEYIRSTEQARKTQERTDSDPTTASRPSVSHELSADSTEKEDTTRDKSVKGELSTAGNGVVDESHRLPNSQTTVSVDSSVNEQHSLRLLDATGHGITVPYAKPYILSLGFLDHSSIALENQRERAGYRNDWAKSAQASPPFGCKPLIRNSLHVLASTTMLLEKSLLEIEVFRRDHLSEPKNHRQHLALLYRQEQSRILGTTLQSLHQDVRSVLALEKPFKQFLRLKDILEHGPKGGLKKFRALIHTALGTRNPQRIMEGGGEECTFTFWFCVLWRLAKEASLEGYALESSLLKNWLRLIERMYGQPPTEEVHSNSEDGEVSSPDDEELQRTAASYQYALQVHAEKEEVSDASPNTPVAFLVWCLNIVRQESVRVPIPHDNLEEEEDELVLFIETADDMINQQ